jgi:hypothetical protein
MRASILAYYIPETVDVTNPSGRLRRLGFRIDGSVWVIPTGDLPYKYLHDLERRGVTWHAVEFGENEGAKLVRMATAAITAEIRRGLASAERSAAMAIVELEGSEEPLAAEIRYNRQTGDIVRRVNNLVKDMREVAGRFGIDAAELMNCASGQVVSIKAGMRERARLYAAAIDELRAVAGDNDPMVKAALKDNAPPLILADYMEDNDVDATALRAGFEGE